MKRVKLTFIPLLVFILPWATTAFAQVSNQSYNQKLQDLSGQITQLEGQISLEQGKEKTLNYQLHYIDSETQLIQLQTQQANEEIANLNSQLSILDGRLQKLSGSLDTLTSLLLSRIVATYKYQSITPLDLVFSSTSFSQLLERMKYIEAVQSSDRKLTDELLLTRSTYNVQENEKRTKEYQEESLKRNLATYQSQLDQQKNIKAALLSATQGNEATYQKQLQQAIAEQQAILNILGGGGKEVAEGPVHASDIIGYFILGPSPCSNGSHIHLEIHKNQTLEDPANFLTPTSITWDDPFDNPVSFTGSYPWPVFPPIHIEQPFGDTWYAQNGSYTNPPGHTGVDIYSPSSNAVRAIHDGNLSVGSISCGGGTLHYVKIDQTDGYSSYYLHTIRSGT